MVVLGMIHKQFVIIVLGVVLATCLLARHAIAQFDVFAGAAMRATAVSGHAPPPPVPPVPTGFSPTAQTTSDTTSSGTVIASITVTMSDNSRFSGTCSDTDPSGLTSIAAASGGCLLSAARNFSSSNDGTYQITLNFCQAGQCLNPGGTNFTLTVQSTSVPAAANAGCVQYGMGDGSCFNHLAMNMDFTTSNAVSGIDGSTLFNAQTISNWLDCSYGGPGVWYWGAFGTSGFGGFPSCPGAWSIVSETDNGNPVNALAMTYTSSSDTDTMVMSTEQPFQHPQQFYVEYRARSDDTNCAAASCTDIWTYTSPGGAYTAEFDFSETQAPANYTYGGSNWGNAPCPGPDC